jgi:hypothetical protein
MCSGSATLYFRYSIVLDKVGKSYGVGLKKTIILRLSDRLNVVFMYPYLLKWLLVSVVEPEPQGAGTFGRSWSRNIEAPAPGSGSGSA